MNLAEVKSLLTTRRAELQEQIEVVIPKVEELQNRIESIRETIARLQDRRDKLAAWGSKKVEIPNRPGGLPEFGLHFSFELEPLKSRLTGKELAAQVQQEINEYDEQIRQLEREVGAAKPRG